MPRMLPTGADVIGGSRSTAMLRNPLGRFGSRSGHLLKGCDVTNEVCLMEAVVFDWDGTLADSQTLYVDSWRHALPLFGCQPNEQDLAYLVGRAFPDSLKFFSEKWRLNAEEFEAHWRADFRARLESNIATYPDAVACAEELTKFGVPLAIATQTPRHEFDKALAATGLDRLISVSVCRDEVQQPKPAPDLYLEACRRLGVTPDRCIAIEDSVTGVQSAHSAGLFVIAVAREDSNLKQLSLESDLIVTQLDTGDLIEKLSVQRDLV